MHQRAMTFVKETLSILSNVISSERIRVLRGLNHASKGHDICKRDPEYLIKCDKF